MTREEAIKTLTRLCRLPLLLTKNEAEAVKMAIEALKKQVPLRVFQSEKEYTCYCPSCEYPVLDCDYCKHCGQRLDWWDE